MKRILYKSSIIIPLAMIIYSFTESFAFCIPEIDLYMEAWSSRALIVVVTVVWLCCSPFKCSTCNGTITELLFNMVPVELVLMLVFAQWHFIPAALITLSLVAGEIALFAALRKDEKKYKYSKKRHRKYQSAFHRCSVLGITVLCSIPCFLSLFVYGLQSPFYKAKQELWDRLLVEIEAVYDADDTSKMSQQDNELWLCFEKSRWEQWSLTEKVTIMQQLADYESTVLGIPTITVKTGMIGDSTLGSFSNKDNEIRISAEHLAHSPVDACIQTICHEVFHFNQYYIISSLDWDNPALSAAYFNEIREWMSNQYNYKNAISYGFDTYENQPLEVSARTYAKEETAKIEILIRQADVS